jgi:hypothetical protein
MKAFCFFEFSRRFAAEFEKVGIEPVCVDLRLGSDIFTWQECRHEDAIGNCYIIAHPPCTEFAGSGATWWAQKAEKSPEKLEMAVRLVYRTLHLVSYFKPLSWFIENPVGRIEACVPELYSLKKWCFHPYRFAEYADDPTKDAYTKKTCLWGDFIIPKASPIQPVKAPNGEHSMDYCLGITNAVSWSDRAELRSLTPQGFARAWVAANVGKVAPEGRQTALF